MSAETLCCTAMRELFNTPNPTKPCVKFGCVRVSGCAEEWMSSPLPHSVGAGAKLRGVTHDVEMEIKKVVLPACTHDAGFALLRNKRE